jgi:hypothetical protein
MKLLPLAGLVATTLLAGCKSGATFEQTNHWSLQSVSTRVQHHFLGYDPTVDGEYIDHQWRQKKDIELTLRRHLFNDNPLHPLKRADPNFYKPRGPHSILPYPWSYIHVEGLIAGLLMLNPGTGVFVPVPFGSIIATASPGGVDEFMEGIERTLKPEGAATASFDDYSAGEESGEETVRMTWTSLETPRIQND